MTTFGQRIQGRDNNFDFLRFAFAAAVLFSHSFVQLYGVTSADPLSRLTHDRTYIGELAVNGFFIISGFLIATSWVRSKGWLDFLKNASRESSPATSSSPSSVRPSSRIWAASRSMNWLSRGISR